MFGNFLKKKEPKPPDNSKLIELLNIYGKNKSGENYKNAVLEISNNNCYLLLPSIVNEPPIKGWQNAEKPLNLKLTCITFIDGVKVLCAFTDEKSLDNWAKNKSG